MKKAIIICGPTATGKTDLALHLIKQQYPFEIISADSRQAYKHLDVITGKDKPKNINIYGYDLFDTDQKINISDYRKKILKIINIIYKNNKIPLIVGGSGFYIDAIVRPPETLNIKPDKILREKLADLSASQLYKKLYKINKNTALQLNESDKKNKVRLIRKIEIEMSDENIKNPHNTFDNILWIGLTADFEFIKNKIRKRVVKRSSLIDKEVNFLKENNLYTDIVKNIIGYKSWGKENAIDEWIKDEINYAKRQLTWFKKNDKIHWFDIQNPNYKVKVEELVKSWHNKSNTHA